MIVVKLAKCGAPVLRLRPSADLLVVRTRSGKPLSERANGHAGAAPLAEATVVMAVPEAGVEVYRVPLSGAELARCKAALASDPDVRFVGSALTDDSGEPVLYTENLFIKFVDTLATDEALRMLRTRNLTVRRRLDPSTPTFLVAAPEGTGRETFAVADDLLALPEVESCQPELVWVEPASERAPRAAEPSA